MRQNRTMTHDDPARAADLDDLSKRRKANLPVLHRPQTKRPSFAVPIRASQPTALPVPSRQGNASVLASQNIPAMARFDVARAQGSVSVQFQTTSLEPLPRGSFTRQAAVGRWTTVATLKHLVGQRGETVLIRHGRGWRPVSDSHVVDLTDRSVEFLIGAIAIYS